MRLSNVLAAFMTLSNASEVPVIQVTVVYSSAPRHTREWHLSLPVGSCVSQAVVQSGAPQEFVDLGSNALALGIWGKPCGANQVLKDNDRIEIYRPLRVDPKVARRERFSQQGAKRAGLFASKRVGSKAGYGG